MIRIFASFFMVLGAVATLAAVSPQLALAEVFIKRDKGTAEKSEESAKGGVFVPLKNVTGKVFNPWKKEKSLTSGLDEKDVAGFNMDMLTSAGGPPKTAEDLLMIAAAHNAIKNEALSKMRADIQKNAPASVVAGNNNGGSSNGGTRKIGGESATTDAVALPTEKKPRTKLFLGKDREKKSGGVFKNY